MGVLLALGFDLPALALLAPLGLAGFFALACSAEPRRAAREGFVVGFVFFALLLRWFAAVLLDFSSLGPWIAAGAVLASGAILGTGTALVAWGTARLARRFGVAWALAGGAMLWVGFEISRAYVPFPFLWGTQAAALATRPTAQWSAALIGSWGVSILAALLAAALSYAVLGRDGARSWRPLALVLVLWTLAALGGLFAMPPAERSLRVGVAQGCMSRDAAALDELVAYEELTSEAATRGARLVVWPESAVSYRLDRHAGYRARLEALASRLDVDLLVQSVIGGGEAARHNSAALVLPRIGWMGRVDKRQLVPFGEYLPMRWLFGDIPAIAAEAGDFVPGRRGGLLAARDARVGPLVCYESIFPAFAREAAGAGADVLVTMTNDSWFGWTEGPAQHLRHGILRAHETGLPLLRAANTGISTIIDPRKPGPGPELGLGARGVIVQEIGIPGRPAPGVVVGGLAAIACATLSLAALVAALLASPPRSARPPGLPGGPAASESREDSVDA